MKLALFLCAAAILVAGMYSPASATGKIEARLAMALSTAGPADRVLVWVFLTDKGSHELEKNAVPLSNVSPRALQRRRNVLPPDQLVDYADLPVEESYVDAIARQVVAIRQRSKWFNTVSVEATPGQIADLANLPFVRELTLVARFGRPTKFHPVPADAKTLPSPAPLKQEGTATLNYGPSLGQLTQIDVPAVHNLGNYAQGVIIGMMDDGWRILNHQSFDSLRPRIIATHDFVDHKTSVIPEDPTAGFHGVATLSALGGYWPGQLIGPAFGASFILSRTENDSSETPIEEDNWAAAIEWAESLGVQVTSTSLGYLAFDAPYTSLTWQDMNGRTAIISLAATMAAREGVVVVNAAGNDAGRGGPNTLDAPADADSILSVGAVTSGGTRASFSSYGPTSDGRIKPDVMAQGVSVYAASAGDTAGYGFDSGTSLATPLAAGVAALLVKSKPTATPMEIINAMRNTASQHSAPDNYYGWGIIDALGAYNYLNGIPPGGRNLPSSFDLHQNYPNPFNPGTWISYDVRTAARVTIRVYDVLGQEITTLVDGNASASPNPSLAFWDGTSSSGHRVGSGVYFFRMSAVPLDPASGGSYSGVRKMVLVR